MKKWIAWGMLFVCLFTVGCGKQAQRNNTLLPEETAVKAEVLAFPVSQNFTINGNDAQRLAEKLSGFTLAYVPGSDLETYTGQTWMFTFTYESGETAVAYVFADLFMRVNDGSWYKITDSKEGALEAFLDKLH